MKYYFTFLLFILTLHVGAQEKIEVEFPIPHKKVPDTAKKVICELFPGERVKWMLERNNHGDNLEAKLKVDQTRFSVEFNRKGEFEDLEKEVPLSYLEKLAAQRIKEKLAGDFDRYKIKRIQHHYSGDQNEVLKLYKTGQAQLENIFQRFEIVVYGIKDGKINSYEYTFTLEGDFAGRLINAEENTDNLLF